MDDTRICLITYGGYPDPTEVTSGNSVRGGFLTRGLIEHGIDVDWLFPAFLDKAGKRRGHRPLKGVSVDTYRDPHELHRKIDALAPQAILVGYWELLQHFPEDYPLPVVVDVVAPRILESMYERGSDLGADVQRLVHLYRRADLFLAGNRRQKHFLLPWLILAGFDCRQHSPALVLPISAEAGPARPPRPRDAPWRFVTGGVSWPWRRSGPWIRALVHTLGELPAGRARVELLSGKYVYAGDGHESEPESTSDWPAGLVRESPLMPYGDMSAFLASACDIGIELADENTEREYSQSFRAMEFLRSGLPLICNRYLELAGHIQGFDAGWVIDTPEELPALVRKIMADPESWAHKSANAQRLVAADFDYRRNTAPLADFLRHPQRPVRGPVQFPQAASGSAAAVVSAPLQARSQRLNWKGKSVLALGRMLRRLFPGRCDGVISVTRSDIFPPDHGAAVKIDRTAWGLSHRVEAVYLVTDDRRVYHRYERGERQALRYPFWLSPLAPSRRIGRRGLERRGIPRDNAFLYDPLYDWSFILRSLYVALRHGPRRYLAEFPAYARPCLWAKRLLGGSVMIAEHNVEYQRLREQYPDMSETGYQLARSVELHLCKRADAVVTVSERDKARLAADGVDYRLLHLISHGVDLQQFVQVQAVDLQREYGISPGTPVLVYHGIYLYPPNLEAMQVLAREILPLLHERGIHPKVLAVGRNPPEQELHGDIVFTGPVDSVAPYLCAADLAVVPLLQGGGTRMKLLDYFAAGLPVVSTAKGAEGLPLQDGREILIRDDYAGFADAVVRVLGSRELAVDLSQKGRAFVNRLDWRNIAAEYVELFRNASGA